MDRDHPVMFHVEQAETSLIVIQRCVRNDQRFFAKPVLSEAEGLRMTMLCNGLIYRVSECHSRIYCDHVLVGASP